MTARRKSVTLKRTLAGTQGKRRPGRPATKLAHSHLAVLRHLGTLGTPQTKLAEYTGLSASTLSNTLTAMESKKLIKRKLLPTDLRMNLVMPTTKGSKALDRSYGHHLI